MGARFLLCIVLVAGCDDPCEDTARHEMLSVELGQGLDTFAPLHAGSAPVPELGPQGGQHLWLGVRLDEPAPGPVTIELRADDRACSDCGWVEVGGFARDLDDPRIGDGPAEWAGLMLVVARWAADRERRLTAVATDQCDRTGAAEHPVDPTVQP